jgi:hypothetical protein
MGWKPRGILSPVRLPVSPLRHNYQYKKNCLLCQIKWRSRKLSNSPSFMSVRHGRIAERCSRNINDGERRRQLKKSPAVNLDPSLAGDCKYPRSRGVLRTGERDDLEDDFDIGTDDNLLCVHRISVNLRLLRITD